MNRERFGHLLRGGKPKRSPVPRGGRPASGRDSGRLCTHPRFTKCRCAIAVAIHDLEREIR